MKPIQLLLVDDQDLIRESLHIVLDMDPEIDVVGMAENGRAALELCEAKSPNVVLMDIHMPVMDGVEATKLIKARWPEIRVIILTTFQEISYVVEALGAGAEGYLLKAIHPKDLASGIKWVHKGGTLIPQDIAKMLVNRLQQDEGRPGYVGAGGGGAGSGGADGWHSSGAGAGGVSGAGGAGWAAHGGGGGSAGSAGNGGAGALGGAGAGNGGAGNSPVGRSAASYGLSEREQQVLHAIADGLNNREIAEKLFLSEGTVKNYISSIYSKMDVRDRIQAARKAQEEGLL